MLDFFFQSLHFYGNRDGWHFVICNLDKRWKLWRS